MCKDIIKTCGREIRSYENIMFSTTIFLRWNKILQYMLNVTSSTMVGPVSCVILKDVPSWCIANDAAIAVICSDFGADLTKGPLGPWNDTSHSGVFPICEPVNLHLPKLALDHFLLHRLIMRPLPTQVQWLKMLAYLRSISIWVPTTMRLA